MTYTQLCGKIQTTSNDKKKYLTVCEEKNENKKIMKKDATFLSWFSMYCCSFYLISLEEKKNCYSQALKIISTTTTTRTSNKSLER